MCVEALSRRSYVGVGWWRRKVCTVFMWKDPQCTSGIKSVYRVLGGVGRGGAVVPLVAGKLLCGTADKDIQLERSFKGVGHLNTRLRMQLDLVV